MDTQLLHFTNQTLAHPLLDWLMIALTTVGFGALPLGGLALTTRPTRDQRRVGQAILAALLVGGVATLAFYYLALRPRPEHALVGTATSVRLLLPTPALPSFPSGHSVGGFAFASVVILAARGSGHRWFWTTAAGLTAVGIASSRVYLGHHYPSDVLGGAVLGTAIGAACYGLLVPQSSWLGRLRWLLWPQVAVVLVATQMAYLGYLPWWLLAWPGMDKVLHALLFGSIAFWLNLWWDGRSIALSRPRWQLPLAVVVPLGLIALEEGLQTLSPRRSADWRDLVADLVGITLFWWLSQLARRRLSNSVTKPPSAADAPAKMATPHGLPSE